MNQFLYPDDNSITNKFHTYVFKAVENWVRYCVGDTKLLRFSEKEGKKEGKKPVDGNHPS